MKTTKLILLIIALILIAMISNAQNSKTPSGGKAFGPGTKVLNVGVGIWGRSYYGYGKRGLYVYRQTPALSLSYEQALNKAVGPGYLGIGAYIGYQSSWVRYDDYYYNNNRYYYKHNWRHTVVMFRAAYHADDLMTDNAELYFGAAAGLRFNTYRFSTDSPDPDMRRYEYSSGNVSPAYSVFVGGRYYFTDNFGAYAEIGYGISYLTLGLSFKF